MNVTLVIPCYNEEVNIQKGVLDRVGNYTKDHEEIKEVIIVDDGSSDSSTNIIKDKYLPLFTKFKLVENSHQGKALAVMTGIEKARYPFVMFSDIDLATPLEESEKILNGLRGGSDVVIGSRAQKRQGAPFTRKLQSMGFTFVRNTIIGLHGIQDTQCGFKGFKKEVAEKIIAKQLVFAKNHQVTGSSVSAAFDLEFLFLARKLGYTIQEVPVLWRHAESKNVSLIKDSLETLKDVFAIRLNDLQGKYT
ncbi:MAG: Undecaprenyl-phosphate 4-deoxy-4-formamido-L-arabinose transferase [Microgenomates bacterium OLB23]|nr:MAG: Undecaprenyl-phosphate 4-deoxy-4-formamido-L-arabinose transferase [Microgenomates bacterium OLB23]